MFPACLLLLACIGLYLYNVIKKGVTPNPTNFFVRSVVAIINVFTYFKVAHGNFYVTSMTIVSAIGLLAVFGYAKWKSKFCAMSKLDYLSCIIAMITCVIWKLTNGVVANYVLQIIMFLAFLPAITAVLDGRAKEKALPWLFATAGYVLMSIVIIGTYGIDYGKLIHPLISGVAGNGLLALSIIYKKRK